MEDKLEKLYNNISGEYDLPDLNTFKADMADPAKLGKLHQTLTQDNWELPDLQTFQRDMFPQKKNESSPVSQPQSETASLNTGEEFVVEPGVSFENRPDSGSVNKNAPVSPASQPPVAKLGTPEAMLEANEQAELGADDARRSKAIAETMFGISRLAQTKRVDENYVKNSLGKIMADESKPKELRDVLALREAYKVFNNAGVSRGGGEFTEDVHSGDDMLKVWEHLSKAEANLRQKNPVEWNKLIQQSKESHYEKLGASEAKYVTPGDRLLKEKVADKQLIASAIDNGVTGLEGRSYQDVGGKLVTEADEAKLRNEMSNLELKLDIANKSGDPKLISVAQTEYNRMKTEADRIRTIRHKSITDQITQAKTALDRTDLPEMARSAGLQILKDLENEERGFIDPSFQFGKVLAEYKEEIAEASDPSDSPQVAMRKYLGNLLFEKKVLDERLSNESMAAGISRELTGLTIRGWNDDERRSKELENKIKSVSRVVLLNELPETSGAMNAGGGSFVNTLWGSSTMGKLLDTNTTQGRALDTQEMFDAVGLDPQMMNPEYAKRFETRKEGPGWFSFEHLASLGGMVAAMGLQAEAGGGAMKGLGIDKVFGQMRALPKGTPGAKFANVVTRSLEKGAQYEITGDVFKDQEHFFNIATGIAGGAAEGVVSNVLGAVGKGLVTGNEKVVLPAAEAVAAFGKGASKKMARMWVNTFGNKTGEATKWLLANGQTLQQATTGAAVATAQRVAGGTGSVVGQFAEGNIRNLQEIGDAGDESVVFSDMVDAFDGLVKIFQDSDVRAEYRKGLEEQFGATPSERVGFFADMFVMGLLHGGHPKGLGNKARERASEVYREMTETERAYADEIVTEAENMGIEFRRRAVEETPTLDKNTVASPPKDFVEKPMSKIEDAISKSGVREQERIAELGENPSKKDVKKIRREGYDERQKLAKENPQYEKFRKEQDDLFSEYHNKRKAIDPDADLFDPKFDALWKEYDAKEKAIADKYAIKDTVLESAREDARLRSELEIEGKDLKAEVDPTNKGPEVEEVSPEPVVEPVVETEVVAEPVVETKPTREEMTTPLEENIGATVDYEGIEGRLEKDSDGNLVVVSSDGTETLIEGGLSGKTAAELGVKKVVGEATVELKDEHTEPIQENKITYNPETSEVGIYGKQYTYEGVNVDENGNTVSLRVKDANGKVKTIRNPEAIAEIEFQKELAELENASGITVEEINREAQENGIEPKDETTKTREGGVEEVQQAGSGEITEKPQSQTPAIEEPLLEAGVKPAAETGSGVPPEPPIVNEAAGGGVPPLNPPTIEPVNQGGGTPPPTTNTGSGGGTPPPTVPPTTTETTGGGPMKERATPKTYSKYVDEGAFKDMLDRAEKYYRSQTHKDLYNRAMNQLQGMVETVHEDGTSSWHEPKDGKKSPFEMVEDLISGKQRDINSFADVLAQRQVLAKLTSDAMDVVAKKIKASKDPVEIADMEADLARFAEMRDKLGEAIFQQGTIGGQGISFIGHFRDMYENPEAMIWNEIAQYNKARKEAVKEKSKEIATGLGETRDNVGKEVANSVANGATVNGIAEQSTATAAKNKAKGSSSKDSIAKAKDSIAKSREALSKNINSGGKALGLGLVGATLVSAKIGAVAAYHVTKIGVELAKIGAIKFMDWASQMRQELKGVVALSDAELKDIWDTGKIGKESPREISEAALKRASVAAKKMNDRKLTLREQIQKELKASNSNGDLQDRLKQNVGLTSEEAAYVIKHGDAVITATAARVEAREFEAAQKLIDAKADSVQKSRKAQTKQRISRAMESSIKKDGGKNLRESLVSEGFSEAEADAITLEQGADFGKRADEALKRAGDPARPVKVGDPSLRKRMQDVFDSHFSIKNTDSSTLKERLVRDAGLSEAQAETVLKQQAEYISKLEAAVIDKIEAKERQQIAFEHYQDFIARREAVAESVNKAITDYYKDPTGKPIEERLADNGLDPVQVQEIMDARATEFAQGAVDAITKAAKEPLPKTKAGEPTIRQKIQNAFNDHFNPKNAGAGITLKERLTKDVGLTEAQAETVLREENQQLSNREQAMVDEVLRRENENAQKEYEQQVRDEAIQEQRDLKNNVKGAINEHFGKDNIKNKVEAKLAADAGLPDPAIDKLTQNATGTAPAIGSTISANGFDYQLKSVSADGKTLNYERVIPEAEATKRKEIANTAKKAATFGKMRLLDGKTLGREELKKKVAEATGLEGKALDDVVDLMQKEATMSFADRIEEKTGLPRAEAEKIAAEANKEFQARAKQHVEAKVKGLKSKPAKDQVHRPTTDVDRALGALMDGELTTDMVNDIFKDRLKFKEQMTPEQVSRMRGLAKALARTDPGSQLELDAARKLDLAFDEFLPDVSSWSKAGEYWKAWAYANMLNGISTSAVNIISSSGYILAAPALNIMAPSEWTFAIRNAINAQGGGKAKLDAFARSSPVAAAAVKYVAGFKGIKQARRRASDIFYEGYIDNKFLGQGKQALGRQMNILERRAATFKAAKGLLGKYSALLKFSARNLAAQDVFIRTIAHEMQLADAVRRADVFMKRGDMAALGFNKDQLEAAGYNLPALRSFSYPQWVNFQMSMNNPAYKGAVEIAIQDVQAHEQLTGGLTNAQRKRYVETRTKEIIRFGGTNEETGEKIEGLRLSEKEFEDAESVARSQIFTHQRGGVYSKWSGTLASFTGKKAKFLWPLIPFTTIIGNLSDTMADFNPLTGVARANGISMSELIAEFQRSNNRKNNIDKPVLSAKMGDQSPYGVFTSDRIKSAIRDNKDAKYYEQMARYWTGVQGLLALSMMVNENPYGQGLGLTGSQDDKPYMITWNGEAIWSYKDLPFIAPAATLVAQWHQWNREKPEKKDQEWYEESGARLWYALGEAELISSKVSVAEGSMRAMDLVQGVFELGKQGMPWEDTPDRGEKIATLMGKISKPYVSVLTKPIPWRASLVEQIGQVFDPSVYSKSDIVNSLTYAFTGAAYKLPGIDKVEMVDIYGDPVKKFPGEDRMAFLASFKDDISQRPHVKFMNERGIVLAPTQNRAVAWEDQKDILGVSYKDYTTEQFAYFAKTSGEYFKTMLTGGTIRVGERDMEIPGIMNVDPELRNFMDNDIVSYGQKKMTATEKEVRQALSNARSLARDAVKAKFGTSSSSPMLEGSATGGVNNW